MSQPSSPQTPQTIGQLRCEGQVDKLIIDCRTDGCEAGQLLDIYDQRLDFMQTLDDIAKRMRCQNCGLKNVKITPRWSNHHRTAGLPDRYNKGAA